MTSSYEYDRLFDQFLRHCAEYNFKMLPITREKFSELVDIGLTLHDLLDIAYDINYGYTLTELLPFYIYEGKRINQVHATIN